MSAGNKEDGDIRAAGDAACRLRAAGAGSGRCSAMRRAAAIVVAWPDLAQADPLACLKFISVSGRSVILKWGADAGAYFV